MTTWQRCGCSHNCFWAHWGSPPSLHRGPTADPGVTDTWVKAMGAPQNGGNFLSAPRLRTYFSNWHLDKKTLILFLEKKKKNHRITFKQLIVKLGKYYFLILPWIQFCAASGKLSVSKQTLRISDEPPVSPLPFAHSFPHALSGPSFWLHWPGHDFI